jgi:hypothetical protein
VQSHLEILSIPNSLFGQIRLPDDLLRQFTHLARKKIAQIITSDESSYEQEPSQGGADNYFGPAPLLAAGLFSYFDKLTPTSRSI